MVDIAEGQAQDAQIQNIVFNKTGKLVPRYTSRKITKYKKRMVVNDSDIVDIFNNKQEEDLTSTEYMMRYCRSKNYNFQPLLPLKSNYFDKRVDCRCGYGRGYEFTSSQKKNKRTEKKLNS